MSQLSDLGTNTRMRGGSAGGSLPIGAIIPHGGTTAPVGFLLCHGQAISRTDYADLFAAIGTAFGVGDGAATFNVPDSRGIGFRGAGAHGTRTKADGTAYDGGVVGAALDDQMQGHTHGVHTKDGTTSGSTTSHVQAVNPAATSRADNVTTSPTDDGTNDTPRTGNETRGATISVEWIIKFGEASVLGVVDTNLDARVVTLEGRVSLLLHVCEKQAYNVDGGTFTQAGDRTRVLNTVVTNEITGASLASNQIVLPAGTYDIEWSAPAYSTIRHWTWLYNITTSAIARMGSAEYAAAASAVQSRSFGKCRLVLASATTFEIRHRCTSTANNNGLGSQTSVAGFDSIYTEVFVRKIA